MVFVVDEDIGFNVELDYIIISGFFVVFNIVLRIGIIIVV